MGSRCPSDDDSNRPLTKADLDDAKSDLRREIKLWVGIALAGGQVVAALVAGFVADDPLRVRAAAESLIGLLW